MWYISVQYMHMHTHTHTNSMVQWWFYPERYVVHQCTAYAHMCMHTHTQLYGALVVLSRDVCGTSPYSICSTSAYSICTHTQLYGALVVLSREVQGGTIQRGMHQHTVYTHTHTHTQMYAHTHTHTYTHTHTLYHLLLLINSLLKWGVTARGMLCVLAYCIIIPWAVHMQAYTHIIHALTDSATGLFT